MYPKSRAVNERRLMGFVMFVVMYQYHRKGNFKQLKEVGQISQNVKMKIYSVCVEDYELYCTIIFVFLVNV